MIIIKNLLIDFKERLCPSTRVIDMKNKLKEAFDESLKVKDEHIMDLKREILQLKKTRICCFCDSVENLTEFHLKLWKLTGYRSYHYCNKNECVKLYVSQLENL